MSKQELVRLIEKKRSEMIQVAMAFGYTSKVAIQYSQELDVLINTYNKLEKKPCKTH